MSGLEQAQVTGFSVAEHRLTVGRAPAAIGATGATGGQTTAGHGVAATAVAALAAGAAIAAIVAAGITMSLKVSFSEFVQSHSDTVL